MSATMGVVREIHHVGATARARLRISLSICSPLNSATFRSPPASTAVPSWPMISIVSVPPGYIAVVAITEPGAPLPNRHQGVRIVLGLHAMDRGCDDLSGLN